ncbi:MAG TPA: single-stranded DNA-binding protein [Acidocella sp.]|jgi:single-strand DNA-binding protein|uniref:single-stranded DNA-binding protein n=1 Tax=Acidocella sp. TaxID=50710 RepID=UPI002BC011A7|nr:single-stranded DNA-binding protein [Acidocella sp.]HVE21820.1 single-stranded DNA-binding protein [Acidocella sp.]
MSGFVNKAMIVGRLGKDPHIRNTHRSGIKIVTLTVATCEHWTDASTGMRREHVEWHRVVIMNEALGDVAEKFLRKGAKIYAEGKLMTRRWVDQDGAARATTEINLGRYHGTLTLLDAQEEDGPWPCI